MLNNISNLARITITSAIFLQLFSMYSKKNKSVNVFAFFLYGIGCIMSAYGYYVEDHHTFQFRFIIKSLNSVMLLLIALYAYVSRRK